MELFHSEPQVNCDCHTYKEPEMLIGLKYIYLCDLDPDKQHHFITFFYFVMFPRSRYYRYCILLLMYNENATLIEITSVVGVIVLQIPRSTKANGMASNYIKQCD